MKCYLGYCLEIAFVTTESSFGQYGKHLFIASRTNLLSPRERKPGLAECFANMIILLVRHTEYSHLLGYPLTDNLQYVCRCKRLWFDPNALFLAICVDKMQLRQQLHQRQFTVSNPVVGFHQDYIVGTRVVHLHIDRSVSDMTSAKRRSDFVPRQTDYRAQQCCKTGVGKVIFRVAYFIITFDTHFLQ